MRAKRPSAFMSPTVRFTCERRANSISTRHYGGVSPACPRQPLTDLRKAEGEVDQILDDVAECVVAAALEKCSS